MIKAKDTPIEIINEFSNNHAELCIKSHNRDSTSNTHHTPPRDDSEEIPNHDSDKDNMQIDQDGLDKVSHKVSEENDNDKLQSGSNDFPFELEKDEQNLNQDDIQHEVLQAQVEPNQSGNLPNNAKEDVEEKAVVKLETAFDPIIQSQPKLEHEDDIIMSNEEELPKSPIITNNVEIDVQTSKSNVDLDDNKINMQKNLKSLELLKQLKSFVSNPIPDLKSKFNNNIPTISNLIGEYKQSKIKSISLANEIVDPLKEDNLQEGIRRARFVRLQTEKRGKLSPKIFNPSSINTPTTAKAKLPKTKSGPNFLKNKAQVSLFKVKQIL
jgi:hypothetical protein